MEACKQSLTKGNWFSNWHFVLPEDGALVQKHAGDTSLIFIYRGAGKSLAQPGRKQATATKL